MSIFLLVWILGEIADTLHDNGIVIFSVLQGNVGLQIHVISMIFFSTILWLRFYYSERSSKIMVEEESGAGSGSSSSNSLK
jgi:phosphatidylglycerophosphate synthase